jgi:hypothetical protein
MEAWTWCGLDGARVSKSLLVNRGYRSISCKHGVHMVGLKGGDTTRDNERFASRYNKCTRTQYY